MTTEQSSHVFSPREIARAAGVHEDLVHALIERGQLAVCDLDTVFSRGAGRAFVGFDEAVRAVRALQRGEPLLPSSGDATRQPLSAASQTRRAAGLPLALSTSLHAIVLVALLVIGSLGWTSAQEQDPPVTTPAEPMRLVYLALPGPGGGGGGGGLRMPTPATKATRQGSRPVASPLPARRPPPPPEAPPLRPEPPPPPLEAKTLPPVFAPVAPIAANPRNQEGAVRESLPNAAPSQGPGAGGGSGSGQGTGLGEGRGSGIGDGEGGGMGGGPYRPGSGVLPPRLLREVRADYTEEGRRANVSGEVVLEIVVLRNGSVGDVKVLRRLGHGLDQRATAAVRQWRFAPATLKGTPVDVVVEVGVEFTLR